MLQIKVVLVDMTGNVGADKMAAAAEALNVQVTRDLPQFWNIQATVSYQPDQASVPQGMWPVQLVKSLPPGEGGFHVTKHNQPYAKVIWTEGSDDWTVDAATKQSKCWSTPTETGCRRRTQSASITAGSPTRKESTSILSRPAIRVKQTTTLIRSMASSCPTSSRRLSMIRQ
jgi:hypothetical protein